MPRRNRLWPWECDCVKQKSGLIHLTTAPKSVILRKITREDRQKSRLTSFFPLVTSGGGSKTAKSLVEDERHGTEDESEFGFIRFRFEDELRDRLVVRRIVDCGDDEQASLIKRSRASRSMVKRCSSILQLTLIATIPCVE